jgi:hypothetical protein
MAYEKYKVVSIKIVGMLLFIIVLQNVKLSTVYKVMQQCI